MFSFMPVNVDPELFHVCVAFKTGKLDVCVAPVNTSAEEPTDSVIVALVGVISPSVKLMAGVVVAVATVPDTPLAVVTDTLVTVPEPDAAAAHAAVPPLTVKT